MSTASAADIHGPWVGHGWDSGLIARARQWWATPVSDLPDAALALFLRQDIAVRAVLPEARRRLAAGRMDGTELYDGELAAAVEQLRPADPGAAPDPRRQSGFEG